MNIRSGVIGKTAVRPGMFIVRVDCPNDPYTIDDVFLVVAVNEEQKIIEALFAVPWLSRRYLAVNPQQPEQAPFWAEMTIEQKCTPLAMFPDDCIDAESVGFRFRIPAKPPQIQM